MTTKTPVAFLLVKFQGSKDEPMTLDDAALMFTATGRGTMNIVDWFDDNTHGHIDMTGNKVFGWLPLTETVKGYLNQRKKGTYHRLKIIDLGRAAAATAGIDLSKFTVVVVVTNVEVDLFGATGCACCTAATAGKNFWENQTAPSVLCQEIIHGLGIYDHSRWHGSDGDYRDPYDVMSMFNAWPGRHPANTNIPVGPGLNAAFMKRCGWLDSTRAAPIGQVDLRPLHRRDLPGPLYSMVDGYYAEYRPARKWDTAFPSLVLVHYIANNTSYVIAELRAGNEFKWGNPQWPYKSHGSIKVDAIDDGAETATITTSYSPAQRLPLDGPVLSIFGSEFGDAGGLVMINGKLIRIPPRSPELGLVEAAVALASINDIEITPALKTQARADIYARVAEEIHEAHEHITGVSSPFDHITLEEARRFHSRDAAE